ncbi:iron-regulated protein [Thauera sp. CAU 1555]|uniref:Iron-regulated protein n=1 Tax=Thauera sedimentorum TaxID=2767595 RepID=A0ABR9BDQ3_9RHOO|nr:imelysin family protein [Thauera sedimentorum]MBC9073130.1 iron-regulated protein [Thauera sedimentorum]MBD8504049.1 iron-regulated protein [Thauera sedimentorum]
MRLITLVSALAALQFSTVTLAAEPVSAPRVLAHYGELVHASYADAHAGALALQKAVDAFVAAPSEAGLQAARKAWLEAREWYGQTEAFRFYGGPIDGEDGPEGQINAWPMDEAYVDFVNGAAEAGIIADRSVSIDMDTLAGLNEKDGEENISTGWHAIEFMLWGQDLYEDSPGRRAYTDFVDGQAPNADRRRDYLKVTTELLVKDLAGLVDAWAPNADNYRKSFAADEGNLARVISAIGILSRGELAGERIEVALDSQNQEDEHSCFSDNTHRDIVANAAGIRNVWRGQYTRADGSVLKGPGVRDLVAAKNKALATRVDSQIDGSVKAAEAIPAPFDRAILAGNPGRAKVEATVVALKKQTEGLVEAAAALGIKRLNTALPE